MSDRLIVKNFGVLKDIDIEIKDFNIIIGTQSQGKSLLGKLVSFFTSINLDILPIVIKSKINYEEFNNLIRQSFLLIFPEYIIKQYSNFSIEYHIKNSKYFINYKSDKILNISFSNDVLNLIGKSKLKSKPFLTNLFGISNLLEKTSAIYIPSGRSFFNILKSNIFFLALQKGTNIDPFILEFGNYYENTKEIAFDELKNKNSKIIQLAKEILKGDYIYNPRDNSDYLITTQGTRLELINSSSGQQEVMPILLLVIFLLTNTKNNTKKFLVVEEPEAHLYPTTQNQVVDFLANAYNESNKNLKFFITTHSPYILTSLNNLIQAHNTFLKQPDKENEISKVIDKDKWVDFENVSVYYLENGKCQSVLDDEDRLINATFIDKVSDDIGKKFNKLIDIEFENE